VYFGSMRTKSPFKPISLGLLLVLLASCLNTPVTRTISGTLSIPGTGARGSTVQTTQVGGTPEVIPGEVLITFKTDLGARSISSLSVGGVSVRAVRSSPLERTSLYRSDAVRSQAETLALVEEIKSRNDVAWAEPNQILHATAVPSDPNYDLQWHYGAINLPLAWDIETGGSNPVTVAVVDTGLLLNHPDMQGKYWPGYDFISNAQQSNDGNGRDDDADDPGDTEGGQGSYHGSHVAGTIAAATNNGLGIAGVSWGAKILPVRVLGINGGSTSDIVAGILWAAGIPVAGARQNEHPAQIINLSLGGPGLCKSKSSLQRAFDQVTAKGVLVVVAAGNENLEAAQTVPASCNGVITVGATDRAGARASYSNYGPRVDVMAPGGEGDVSNNTNEVLSLGKTDQTQEFTYVYKVGTSMATPHVAGVLALMKSKDPNLNFSRALNILKRTARTLTATQCTNADAAKLPEDCGAGLIDAQAALNALNTNPDFSLNLNPSSVVIERGQTLAIKVLQNNIGAVNPAAVQVSGGTAGLGASISNSTLNLSANVSVPLGTYAFQVSGSSGTLIRNANLIVTVIDSSAPLLPRENVAETNIIFCYQPVNNRCSNPYSGVLKIKDSGGSIDYTASGLGDGDYYVWACKDLDNNNVNYRCTKGDLYGEYTANAGIIRPNAINIDIDLDVLQSTTQSGQEIRDKPLLPAEHWTQFK
jgi:serine protease